MFFGVKFYEKRNGNNFDCKNQFFNIKKNIKIKTAFWKFLKQQILGVANLHWCGDNGLKMLDNSEKNLNVSRKINKFI